MAQPSLVIHKKNHTSFWDSDTILLTIISDVKFFYLQRKANDQNNGHISQLSYLLYPLNATCLFVLHVDKWKPNAMFS